MLYEFLTSNYPISIVILLLVGAWAFRNRSSIRLATTGDRPVWNVAGIVAIAGTVLLFTWITVLDNWRQLLGYLIQPGRRWMADPMEAAVTGDFVRTVTLLLLVVSVISVAVMYARHNGPYIFLILSIVFLPIYAFVFNHIRIRADVFLRQAENSLQNPQLLDTGFILFWTTGLVVIIASVVLAFYLIIFSVVALPIRFVYGVLASTREQEVADIFRSYGDHAEKLKAQRSSGSEHSALNQDATTSQ